MVLHRPTSCWLKESRLLCWRTWTARLHPRFRFQLWHVPPCVFQCPSWIIGKMGLTIATTLWVCVKIKRTGLGMEWLLYNPLLFWSLSWSANEVCCCEEIRKGQKSTKWISKKKSRISESKSPNLAFLKKIRLRSPFIPEVFIKIEFRKTYISTKPGVQGRWFLHPSCPNWNCPWRSSYWRHQLHIIHVLIWKSLTRHISRIT